MDCAARPIFNHDDLVSAQPERTRFQPRIANSRNSLQIRKEFQGLLFSGTPKLVDEKHEIPRNLAVVCIAP
jgi:hypothetical protein